MEPLVNSIIRPPRAEYNPDSDLLDEEFLLKGKWYQRKDIEVKNGRGDLHHKCVIYSVVITCPCGCRADASEAAMIFLPSYITVFTLDFSGSGLSGGEHVTLGWNEKDYLKAVVDYLQGSWVVPEVGFIPESSAASKEPATISTADAIKQVCSRRPMSRTEVPSDIPSEENHPVCQDKDTVDDNGPSSSNMISFELSNGHPFGPHVPTTMDDDQYVEYQLDDLTGFPCNVEEEERKFMEAIIESLKVLETRRPHTEEQPKACADSLESLQKDETNSGDTSSTTENCSSLPLVSTSTPVDHHQAPLETESTLVINSTNVTWNTHLLILVCHLWDLRWIHHHQPWNQGAQGPLLEAIPQQASKVHLMLTCQLAQKPL